MGSTARSMVGDFPVANKILVVTGGGSGIGLAYAQHFHAKGGRVLLGDLQLTGEGQAFVDSAQPAGSVVFQRCDVTHWAELHGLISASVAAWGEVPDVYCASAGVFEPSTSNFWADSETEGYASMRINAEHPVKLTRLALRALVGADKKGVVVLVASLAGVGDVYESPLYCASKHAVVGLAKSMGHADSAEGVKVVCLCPGMVDTPIWRGRDDSKADAYGYTDGSTPRCSADEVAAVMMQMTEDGKYQGGAVMTLITPEQTALVHEGGPSPYALGLPGEVLAKERGVKWEVETKV